MNMKMIQAVLLIFLLNFVNSKFISPDTPIWSSTFTSKISEFFNSNTSSGTYWYDFTKNRQRTDRSNTFTDQICNSLLPNKTSICTNLYFNNKRFIIFPQQKICCQCCNSQQRGCAMLQPNWLQKATYQGYIIKSWEVYDHWTLSYGQTKIDYYQCQSSTVKEIHRTVNGNKAVFYFNTYDDSSIQDSIFALPSYCRQNVFCPKQSACNKFANSFQMQ